MGFKPCKYCGSTSECYDGCSCAKCVDPEGYDEWRYGNPEEYQSWKEKQYEDNDGSY